MTAGEGTRLFQHPEPASSGFDGTAAIPRLSLLERLKRGLRAMFSFPVILLVWVGTIVLRVAEHNLPDVDLWWHLRNAQYLFTQHRLPNFDTYSFTAAGQPWINYEWAGEIPYYLAWRALGLEGIEILVVLLLAASFLGVLCLCYQTTAHLNACVLACCLAMFLCTVNAAPRTILFGYAYLIILLIVLERFYQRGAGPLWLLPPLFCLWINTHGSWCLGMAVLGISYLAGFAQGEWGTIQASRWSPRQARQLLVTSVASCAALFINPYSYRLVINPFELARRQPHMLAAVEEWASVDFHTLRGKLVLVLLLGLILLALGCRRRWRFSGVVLLMLALYAGLTYERFLFFLAIIVAPVLAELLGGLPRYRPEIDKRWLNAVIICVILAFFVYRFPASAQLERLVAEQFPAEIIPYLQTHPPSGKVLNYYNWGGYLGWKDPGFKVFVDSRVDVFEYAGVFGDYLDLVRFHDPMRVLDKYQIRYVLFPQGQPLIYLLKDNPHWKVVYAGNLSTMLERTRLTPGAEEPR